MSENSIYLRRLLLLFAVASLLFLGMFFVYVPNQVIGSGRSFYPDYQVVLSEKISYIFRAPYSGEFVVFHPVESPDLLYIGAIVDTRQEFGQTVYTIVTRNDNSQPWVVGRRQIISRVYYPAISLSQPYSQHLPLPTSIPTLTPIPTLTSTPVPTRKPTQVPTKIPTSTPASITDSSPVVNNGTVEVNSTATAGPLSCSIVATSQNEGVPQTYNFAYSAAFHSSGNVYVVGAQWDFNNDGNWDTDLNQSTGNVNYTYSSSGIKTIRLQIKDNNGNLAQCSTSVGVQ